MLDAAFIRDNADAVKAELHEPRRLRRAGRSRRRVRRRSARNSSQKRRRDSSEEERRSRKQFQKRKTPEQKQALKEQAAALDKEVGGIDDELKLVEADLLVEPDADPEHDAPDAPGRRPTRARTRSSRKCGEPRQFDFKPKDHVALCEALDLVDFEAGAAVAGQKFYFLKNEAVLLELALVQYAMQTLREAGLHAGHHAGPGPRRGARRHRLHAARPDPETRQVYTIADTDLCLIATAEITLGGMHRDQILDEARAAAASTSACRTASAPRPAPPGRDTRGLYRVHQFTKVEMFAFCTPEQSEAIHLEILAHRGGDLPGAGAAVSTSSTPAPATSAARPTASTTSKRGCPAAATAGEYGEVTSTSNCTDFQARRLNIRYKGQSYKGTRFVHTLNGTAVAVHAGAGRHPGELPAGRRRGDRPRGAAAVGRQGSHPAQEEGLTGTAPASTTPTTEARRASEEFECGRPVPCRCAESCSLPSVCAVSSSR